MTQISVTTIAPTPTSHGALLLTRLTHLAPPVDIRHARFASPADIEATREAIALAHDVFASHVGRIMRALNENMPVTETVDVGDYLHGLADIRSDLDAALIHAADRE